MKKKDSTCDWLHGYRKGVADMQQMIHDLQTPLWPQNVPAPTPLGVDRNGTATRDALEAILLAWEGRYLFRYVRETGYHRLTDLEAALRHAGELIRRAEPQGERTCPNCGTARANCGKCSPLTGAINFTPRTCENCGNAHILRNIAIGDPVANAYPCCYCTRNTLTTQEMRRDDHWTPKQPEPINVTELFTRASEAIGYTIDVRDCEITIADGQIKIRGGKQPEPADSAEGLLRELFAHFGDLALRDPDLEKRIARFLES